MSADERHIVFGSGSNLFVNDRHTGETSRVSVGPDDVQGRGYSPAILRRTAGTVWVSVASSEQVRLQVTANG